MNCSETKPKLGFYLDQVLPDGEIQELKNHLGACMSCSTELQNLKKIESVIQAGIYSEPPDEYWNDVPQGITKRIGIRPKVSAFEQFIAPVGGILSAKSFRWGFAGAFAVAVLIVTLNKVFVTQQAPVSMTQNKSMENEQAPAASGHLKPDIKLNFSLGLLVRKRQQSLKMLNGAVIFLQVQ